MFMVGFASDDEISKMTRAGYDVEPAEKYNLCGQLENYLMLPPEDNSHKAVVVWVDCSVFESLKDNIE